MPVNFPTLPIDSSVPSSERLRLEFQPTPDCETDQAALSVLFGRPWSTTPTDLAPASPVNLSSIAPPRSGFPPVSQILPTGRTTPPAEKTKVGQLNDQLARIESTLRSVQDSLAGMQQTLATALKPLNKHD
jgi:hypothetical protein